VFLQDFRAARQFLPIKRPFGGLVAPGLKERDACSCHCLDVTWWAGDLCVGGGAQLKCG
jgi:hypothetical protein